jgi:F0F1-type ATP synthase assembly protein I
MATGENRPRRSTMEQLAPYLGLGIQLAVAMCFFGGIGWWLDRRFDSSPWMLVAGCVLGATGGMISMIRTSLKKSNDTTGEI